MTETAILEKPKLKREDLVKQIRTWADTNTDALLDADCHHFSTPEIQGFIGYKIHAHTAVVFGDPVCAKENKFSLVKAFYEACQKKNIKILFIIVSKELADWLTTNLSAISMEFGKKYLFDAQINPTEQKGSKAVLVRKKVKHALNEGVVVKEFFNDDSVIKEQIEQVAIEWQKKRKGPQIYIAQVSLFNDPFGKRWFYAEKEGKIVGLLILNALDNQNAWLLNNVMMIKDPPKGLSELLIVQALETLKKEGCSLVIAGPVPSEELGEIKGMGTLKARFVQFIFKFAKHLFHLQGHSDYWSKFSPKEESVYLAFPDKNLNYSSIKALMHALNAIKGI